MINEDHCYECQAYGDDYYWDEETQDYVRACDDCPYNSWEDEG